jgi:Ca2+-binding RTX toxin-like protein
MARIDGTSDPDLLNGTSDNDQIFGFEGDDTVFGGGGPDTIVGGEGLDILNGGTGDDLIFSGSGKGVLGSPMRDGEPGDVLNGGGGNDTIVAGRGDTVDGGLGDNLLILDLSDETGGVGGDLSPLDNGGTATLSDGTQLTGVRGGDLTLGAGADFMQFGDAGWGAHGHGGADNLTGGDGADTLQGDRAADTLTGGDGDDMLVGEQLRSDGSFKRYSTERNVLDGGAGDDKLFGSATDTMTGGGGLDFFVLDLSGLTVGIRQNVAGFATDNGADVRGGHIAEMESGEVRLGSGDDIVTGVGSYALTLSGGAGTDTVELDCSSYRFSIGCDLRELVDRTVDVIGPGLQLTGFEVLSRVLMGNGDDTITTSGNQLMSGGVLSGGAGKDLLRVLGGSARQALIDGGSGDDNIVVSAQLAGGVVDGGTGADRLVVNANVTVGVQLMGGIGNDSVTGGGGDDFIDGGLGDDHLDGGDGIDTVDYGFAAFGVSINLGAGGSGKPRGGQTTGGGGKDTCNSIENVMLTDQSDRAWGSGAANAIEGAAGNDFIDGSLGDDTLTGGGGADTLIGGAGADHFIYNAIAETTAAAPDLIRDFATDDVLDLHLIDADVTLAGNQAFTRVADFTGAAGQMTVKFDSASHTTILSMDVDGDGSADGVIQLLHRVDGAGFTFVL